VKAALNEGEQFFGLVPKFRRKKKCTKDTRSNRVCLAVAGRGPPDDAAAVALRHLQRGEERLRQHRGRTTSVSAGRRRFRAGRIARRSCNAANVPARSPTIGLLMNCAKPKR